MQNCSSRKEQKALNDKWDKSDITQTDKEKIKDALGYIDHLKHACESEDEDSPLPQSALSKILMVFFS